MSRLIDETGKTYGRWTVIAKDQTAQSGSSLHIKWMCVCDAKRGGCGKIFSVHGNLLRGGRTHGCAKCNNVPPQTPKLENGLSAKRSLFAAYKQNAKKQGRVFDLGFEAFVSICSQPCFYCGATPSQVFSPKTNRHGHVYTSNGSFTHNGIDRIDSTKGYVTSNCRPCCWTCNVAKRTMTESEFYQWVSRLYSNMILKESDATKTQNNTIAVSAQKRIFSRYKKGAKKRKIPFSLGLDTLASFLNKSCSYCGSQPYNCLMPESRDSFGKTLYNGIDRKENSKGYEADNCRTCCWTCNNAKRDMTEEEFREWASKTYSNLVLSRRPSHAL